MKPIRELLYLSFHQQAKLKQLNNDAVTIKIYSDDKIKKFYVRPFCNDDLRYCQKILCKYKNTLKVFIYSDKNFVTQKFYSDKFYLDLKNYCGVVISEL